VGIGYASCLDCSEEKDGSANQSLQALGEGEINGNYGCNWLLPSGYVKIAIENGQL